MPPRHTILVVDDEAEVVKSVQALLRMDYRVLGTTRTSEAAQLMEKEEVHVVMTDQRMPEITGVEFLHRLRGSHPDAIRLLFTGYAEIKAVIDAINQGNVYRYITKPWDPDELQTIIREACDRYDLIIQRKLLLAELQEANTELERANRLKADFIQIASHELRTPLTILLGLSALASPENQSASELKFCISRIHATAERLGFLIAHITKMLQAGQFEQVLERRPVPVQGLLRQAAEDVALFVERRKQKLQLDMDDRLGTCAMDATKIRDCLNHLLLNAVKFTPDGGNIRLSGRMVDGQVHIEVADSGVGIDEQTRQRLFEPFFTGFDPLHHSSGQFEFNRKGLGLGLSIVKGFVTLHGGRVSVSSQAGHGAVFKIALPCS